MLSRATSSIRCHALLLGTFDAEQYVRVYVWRDRKWIAKCGREGIEAVRLTVFMFGNMMRAGSTLPLTK